MTKIIFTIPSVLNAGGGEKKTELEASTLKESFEKISEIIKLLEVVRKVTNSLRFLAQLYP